MVKENEKMKKILPIAVMTSLLFSCDSIGLEHDKIQPFNPHNAPPINVSNIINKAIQQLSYLNGKPIGEELKQSIGSAVTSEEFTEEYIQGYSCAAESFFNLLPSEITTKYAILTGGLPRITNNDLFNYSRVFHECSYKVTYREIYENINNAEKINIKNFLITCIKETISDDFSNGFTAMYNRIITHYRIRQNKHKKILLTSMVYIFNGTIDSIMSNINQNISITEPKMSGAWVLKTIARLSETRSNRSVNTQLDNVKKRKVDSSLNTETNRKRRRLQQKQANKLRTKLVQSYINSNNTIQEESHIDSNIMNIIEAITKLSRAELTEGFQASAIRKICKENNLKIIGLSRKIVKRIDQTIILQHLSNDFSELLTKGNRASRVVFSLKEHIINSV